MRARVNKIPVFAYLLQNGSEKPFDFTASRFFASLTSTYRTPVSPDCDDERFLDGFMNSALVTNFSATIISPFKLVTLSVDNISDCVKRMSKK